VRILSNTQRFCCKYIAKFLLTFIFLKFSCFASDMAGLRFDSEKHTYEELLVTISPDLQPDKAGQQAIIGNLERHQAICRKFREASGYL
jgi:hypothetical protein